MQGHQDEGNEPTEQSAKSRFPTHRGIRSNPAFNRNSTGKFPAPDSGTGKYPSMNSTGKFSALHGTGKLPAINSTGKYPSIDLTNKQRAIPRRPSTMPRLTTPPPMIRVPRPQRQLQTPPMRLRKRLLFLGSGLAIVTIIACTLGYLLLSAINASSGPSVTATNFLTALAQSNYNQAYKELGPAITIPTSLEQFTGQAQEMDRCYGIVKDFSEVDGSATNQHNVQSYTYQITRSKMTKPYQIRLQLAQSIDNATWQITNYGTTLGPGTNAPTCS